MASLSDFVPLASFVLVRPSPVKTTTAGGIYLPESAEGHVRQGEILRLSPGVNTDYGMMVPHLVSEGDVIFYNSVRCVDVKLDEGTFVLVKDDQILGVVPVSHGVFDANVAARLETPVTELLMESEDGENRF